MAECVNKLTEDLTFDCANTPVAGIEDKVLLINREDIDLAATVVNKNQITNLVLKSGKKGYMAESVKGLFGGYTKPVVESEGLNGHQQGLQIRVFKNDAGSHEQIDNLVNGANLIAIVEAKQKGENNASAFDVLGWHLGLEVLGDSAGRSYKENEGTYLLTIGTPDGYKEPKSVYKWLQTDYATTKAKFDNKLAS